MADLIARFTLVDDMSAKLDSIAQSANRLSDTFDSVGGDIAASFDGIENGAAQTAKSVDGVAHSLSSSANMVELWKTKAEELEEMYELCDRSAGQLNDTLEETPAIQEELSSAMEDAAQIAEELAESTDVSREAQEAFASALEEAQSAMEEVRAAEEAAQSAMDDYDAVMISSSEDLDALAGASEKASAAADRLAEANRKASEATEKLAEESDKAGEELEKAGSVGSDAFSSISSTLAAAGITVALKEIAEAAYEMANAFSEAESTVVNATGATGEALDGLMKSTMDAYAAAKGADLSSTAAAIGEINTRMGLTGDSLTDVTVKFLDFSNVTGTDVVGNIQNVTKIMNKWEVEGEDVESVLDRLTYAGQVSGASVDSLSQSLITGAASFQNAGLSLDNTIQMLADFEIAGVNSSTAITALRTAVNNFSKEGLDANTALQDTITKISEMGDETDATALAVETFGTRAGQELALAIRNGTISIDTFNASLDDTEGTLDKTAEASQTLAQRWEQANNSMNAAFTSALQPTIDKVSRGFADMKKSIGDFLNDHPVLTKAITAAGIGLGVLVGGITAVAFATKVAIPAIATFGTTLNAALGPIGWIAMAITGVTAAVAAFSAMMGEADDPLRDYTYATQEQYRELDTLESKYDEAVSKYGETSEEASRLKYQIDDLSASIEQQGQTVEEMNAEFDSYISKHDEMIKSIDDGQRAIKDQEVGQLALIQKLADLSAGSDGTAKSVKQIKAIMGELGPVVDDLGISYEDLTTNQEASTQALKDYAHQLAAEQMEAAKLQEYIQLIQDQISMEEELAKATEQADLAQQAMNESADDYAQVIAQNSGMAFGGVATALSDEKDAYDLAKERWEEASDYQQQLQADYDETTRRLQELEGEYDAAAEATDESNATLMTADEVVGTLEEDIQALAAAYNEAYEASLSSIQGQFQLWDEVGDISESSMEQLNTALDSQIEYWNNYADNLATLQQRNIEGLAEMVASMDDGSKESAAALEAMASASDEELASMVEKYNDLQSKQEETAGAMADMQTAGSEAMQTLENDIRTSIENMDNSGTAAQVATATMNAYTDAIRTAGEAAVTEATTIATKVSAALSSAATATATARSAGGAKLPAQARGTTSAPAAFIAGERGHELIARAAAYADGTTDSEPFYIAGESGPELIIGEQGSTVFPTQETDRILSAINNQSLNTQETIAPVAPPSEVGGAGNGGGDSTRHVVIDVAGSGSIEVRGGGADRESILNMIMDNIRPALMNILQTDSFEEADLSYDY